MSLLHILDALAGVYIGSILLIILNLHWLMLAGFALVAIKRALK